MRNCISKMVMSLSPEQLLSSVSRDRCINNIKELPVIIKDGIKKQKSAVLVPLCVHNGDVCLLYTLRSMNLNSHSGQVSFPGGKKDNNETARETALRETEEEIGIPSTDVDIWTEMPLMQGRNKQLVVSPVVGVIKNYDVKKLQPNVDEVAEIFTVPMKELCDPNNHAHLMYKDIMLPVYICGKHKVWGITGIITHFFLQCLVPPEAYSINFIQKEYQMDELMPSKL